MMLVGAGAAIGACSRWGIAEAVSVSAGGFPWPTLIVNLVGCVLIGAAARRLAPASDAWFAGVTGVLGGFTTYSAFANEVRSLLDGGQTGLALTYVGATIAGGLVAVELGRATAR
jgi:CrcB protein